MGEIRKCMVFRMNKKGEEKTTPRSKKVLLKRVKKQIDF